ncbi:ABC transporter permease [Paenibacillus sp. CAU 1782]
MINALRLEFFKIRRKKIGLMLLMFLTVEWLWVFLSVSRAIAKNPDQAAWEAAIFSISSMNGLFMPILTAIIISRICDMEHKGATWKMLLSTNVKRSRLYGAKFACATVLLLLGTLIQCLFILLLGVMKGFEGSLPLELLMRFAGGSMLTGLAVSSLQQWISLGIKNQAFALCLGMLGGFAGMTAGLFPAAFRVMLIWSYYMDLSPVAYRYGENSGSYLIQYPGFGVAAAALIMAVLFYAMGSLTVTRQEI